MGTKVIGGTWAPSGKDKNNNKKGEKFEWVTIKKKKNMMET